MATSASRQTGGWYVISLRPSGAHDALRRAAARRGARLIALSPWRLRMRRDDTVAHALDAALAAPVVVFTSPSSVRAACSLRPLRAQRGQTWLAVGSATASALRRAGIESVHIPDRMDSEGLLALPALQRVRDRDVGLVTAPGGRGLLAPTLRERGAHVRRADVYERDATAPSARAIAQLRAMDGPAALALTSAEALTSVLAALPPDAAAILRSARAIAASERLAALARDHGFENVIVARGPRVRDLFQALDRIT